MENNPSIYQASLPRGIICGASISSALASSLGEHGGEDTDEAGPGLVDEDSAGDASEAAKGEEQ